ncbi:MAG TPA: hypothetical protein VD995_29125 [Azospirillum sp.]|nr:hypothetical protein [Azospirillum sp.]
MIRTTLLILGLALSAGPALAQTMDHSHHAGMQHSGPQHSGPMPTMPGQDAFGTIQEIVGILEADPRTDWSKVSIGRLREHLVDMNEVTLRATSTEMPVDGGLRMAVTGTGRTLDAIHRMVPAHAAQMTGVHGWTWKVEPQADGAVLTVTTTDPAQVAKVRALGFIGLMAQGAHHQEHHLAMARGELVH